MYSSRSRYSFRGSFRDSSRDSHKDCLRIFFPGIPLVIPPLVENRHGIILGISHKITSGIPSVIGKFIRFKNRFVYSSKTAELQFIVTTFRVNELRPNGPRHNELASCIYIA